MTTKKTNRELLIKGIKTMVFALLSLFMGPTLIHMALSNTEKSLYIPLLVVGCLVCTMAVFLIFKGINTIMDSIFEKKTP